MKRYYLFLFAALGTLVLACGSGSEPEIEPGNGTGNGSGGGSVAPDKPKVGRRCPTGRRAIWTFTPSTRAAANARC